MKQYLLYVLPFVGLHDHVAFAETQTVSLGDVSVEWEVTGPCLDGGDALGTEHDIHFKVSSGNANTENYALTFDFGDGAVELPAFPFAPGGSTSTTKLFDEEGVYKCDLTVTVDGETETVSFSNPWKIDASGNCVAGSAGSNNEPVDSGDPEVDFAKAADADESGAAAGSRYVEILLVSIFSLFGAYVMC